MEKILLTIIVLLIAVFIIFSKDISNKLKILLVVFLVVTEIIIVTLL